MLVMLLGVGVATLTEVKLSLFGLAIAMSGVLMTAIYQIVSSVYNHEMLDSVVGWRQAKGTWIECYPVALLSGTTFISVVVDCGTLLE